MVDDSPFESLEARLAKLRAKMEAGFPERARELREAAARLHAETEGDARDAVRRLAHKLRGIAGSHGHAQLSERAGALETLAHDGSTPPNLLRAAANALANLVEQAATGGGAPSPAAERGAPEAPVRKGARELPSLEGRRILAIDDDGHTRKLISMTLEVMGRADARVVEHADELLALAAEAAPDLILIDAMMPEVSGLEVAQRLRAQGVSAPLAFFSAATRAELGWAEELDDAALWLRKPFRPRELLDAIVGFFGARSE